MSLNNIGTTLANLFKARTTPTTPTPTAAKAAVSTPAPLTLDNLGASQTQFANSLKTIQPFNMETATKGKTASEIEKAGATEQAKQYNAASEAQNKNTAMAGDIMSQATQKLATDVGEAKKTLSAGKGQADKAMAQAQEVAKQNVANARLRTYQVRQTLSKLATEAKTDISKGRVDALAASAYNAIGTMKTQLQSTAETYGEDSPEYRMMKQEEATTLQHVAQETSSAWATSLADFDKQYLNITASVEPQMAELEQLHEKTYVDVLQATASYASSYNLQVASAQAQLAQMESSGYTALAEFYRDAPISFADLMSSVQVVANATAADAATKEANRQKNLQMDLAMGIPGSMTSLRGS
jgi:hypothetical protein